jgi:hypothetical protein
MNDVETVLTVKEYTEQSQEKGGLATFCGDCIFAVYEEKDGRPTQTGCTKGRLEGLSAKGGNPILLADSEKNRDYYVIENRICNMCRGTSWQRQLERRGLDQEKTLCEEIVLKPTAIVYMAPGQTVDDAVTTMIDLDAQEIKAAKIIIMNNAGIYPKNFLEGVPKSIRTPWTMEFVVEFQVSEILDALKYGSISPQAIGSMYGRCVDLAVRKTKSVYYSLFSAGSHIPPNYFADIDHALNVDLIRILALSPNKNGDGLFMHRNLHEMVGGNVENIQEFLIQSTGEEKTSLAKLTEEAGVQKCTNLILPVTQIVKNYG